MKTILTCKRIFIGAMLFSACSLASINSHADTIPVDTMNYTGSGLNESVHVQIGNYDVTAHTGFYNIDLTVTQDPLWSGDYSGLAFCGEDQTISEGAYDSYSLYDIMEPYVGATWLMENYLPEATTKHNAASLQVAIWESVMDTPDPETGYDLYGMDGSFYLRDTETEWDSTLSQQYLNALSGADLGLFNTAAYRLVSDDGYGSAGSQDFVVKNSSVPVPSAVLLLGSGLIGLIALGRRKK